VPFDGGNEPIRRTRLAKNLLGLLDGEIEWCVRAGHNNGRNLPQVCPSSHFLQQLRASENGQIHVDNDEVGRVVFEHAQSGDAVDDVVGVEPGVPQDAAVQLRHVDVVLDQQNFLAPRKHHHASMRLQLSIPSFVPSFNHSLSYQTQARW
jgi:hypothetical protein